MTDKLRLFLFMGKVDTRGSIPSDRPELGRCWEWTACRDKDGYGKFGGKANSSRAHRWSYEYYVGPIPEGLHLDHVCRVRHCVNPTHLEPVTARENSARSVAYRRTAFPGATFGFAQDQLSKTHCPHGHPYDEENTYRRPSGARECRTCRKRAGALRRALDAAPPSSSRAKRTPASKEAQ